jgi:hypothetical protein
MVDELISIADRAAWERALERMPHAFAHSWGNCHAMSLTTGDKTFLYHFEADGARIVCPVAERHYGGYTDVYTPYGFSGWVGTCAHREFREAWHALVRQRGYVCGYFSLHPGFDSAERLDIDNIQDAGVSYVLDLTTSREALFSAMHTNRRRQLKHFETMSEDLVHDRAALQEFVLASYADFYRARSASTTYDFRPETFRALGDLDNVLLVGAAKRDGLQAVSIFGYTAAAADFLFNVSASGGKRYSTALIWFAAMQLKTAGVPLLNLGGGVRGNDGVAVFKERFGARRLPLRCAKQVYRPDVYHELCSRAAVDPILDSWYFPAYRAALVRRTARREA